MFQNTNSPTKEEPNVAETLLQPLNWSNGVVEQSVPTKSSSHTPELPGIRGKKKSIPTTKHKEILAKISYVF